MDYLSLFPSASRGKPRFMALAAAILRQVTDLQALISTMESGFSVASAVGVQLDLLGETFHIPRLPGQTDEEYQTYLQQRLKLYRWTGMNEDVDNVLPENVTMSDNGDGTVTVTPSDAVAPVPAGISQTP